MKKLLSIAAFTVMAVLSGSSAFAQTAANLSVGVSGSVPTYCTVSGTPVTSMSVANFAASAIAATPPTTEITIGTVNCSFNGAAVRVTSTNGCLLNTANLASCPTSADGNSVFYTASASWNTISADITPAGAQGASAVSSTTANAGSQPLTLSITPVTHANNLTTGTFSDTIAVAVGAGV